MTFRCLLLTLGCLAIFLAPLGCSQFYTGPFTYWPEQDPADPTAAFEDEQPPSDQPPGWPGARSALVGAPVDGPGTGQTVANTIRPPAPPAPRSVATGTSGAVTAPPPLRVVSAEPARTPGPTSAFDHPDPVEVVEANRRTLAGDLDMQTGINGDAAPRQPRSRYGEGPGHRTVGAMGLYGQIDLPVEGLSSAMDGIDNLQRVTLTSEGADFDPDLDPTGQVMIYASTRHRETADLYLKRIGGNAITQLTDDPANDVMPVISPDGKRVAYASDRAGNWDIYLMDISGGRSVQLTSDPTHDIHPTFSPDGKRLAYCTYGGPSGQWEMVVVDLENPATRKFIGFGLFPTWSPTINRVLYQRARQRGTRWFSVWTIDLTEDGDAGQPTEVAASANAAVITPEWSPDGEHVVFCTVIDPDADEGSGPTKADVWIMNVDGNNRARLTEGKFSNLQPVWSPTGSIFFVSDRGVDRVENIWALRPDRALQLAARQEDEQEKSQSVMVPTP